MSENAEFKRLNFFTGFFTTADDWKAGQNYHLEKRKMHNRLLHRSGILEGLDVCPVSNDDAEHAAGAPADGHDTAQPDGPPSSHKLDVLVTAGAALDASGNLLRFAADQIIPIKAPESLPAWIYLTIASNEEHTDWDQNVQDPDYSGFRRIAERPIVVQTSQEPGDGQLELARIYLSSTDQPITSPAENGSSPVNQIDRSHVIRAGAVDPERDELFQAAQERIGWLHDYHREVQKRQNQGLHTAGILANVIDELRVIADQGLSVMVKPGAALDGQGNQLTLAKPAYLEISPVAGPTTVYIAARYDDSFAVHLADLRQPFHGDLSSIEIRERTDKPDGAEWLELARISMTQETESLEDYDGQGEHGDGVINLQYRQPVRAYGVAPPRLPVDLQETLLAKMVTVRTNYAELARRFLGPSLADARHVALNLQLARDSMEPGQLRPRLIVLAGVLKDVEQELGTRYPPLTRKTEYVDYQSAVAKLLKAIEDGDEDAKLLILIHEVANAAHELAQVVFPPPYARAGDDQTVVTPAEEAVVSLDASGSNAGEGQEIVSYRWEKEQ